MKYYIDKDMTNEQREWKQITTKLSPEAYARLCELCAKKQMKPYTMLQNMCDVVIRYMDDRHNLTPAIEEMMRIFEHMEGWQDCFNWTDWQANPEVGEATYFLQNPGQPGTRAVHVTKPFCGQWTEDRNIQHIVERIICLLLPNRYKQLRQMAVDLNCTNILELLDKICGEHQKEEDAKALRDTFEHNDLSETGRKQWEERYKRHKNQDIEKMQARFDFRPFDQEE